VTENGDMVYSYLARLAARCIAYKHKAPCHKSFIIHVKIARVSQMSGVQKQQLGSANSCHCCFADE